MVSTAVFIIALIAAGFVVWLVTKLLGNQKQMELKSELKVLQTQNEELSRNRISLEGEVKSKGEEVSGLLQKKAELETRLQEQGKNLLEQIANLNAAKEQMKLEFENLAAKIFEEKGKIFSEQNKTNLDLILTPFRQQISDFKAKVEEVYVNEGKERFSLTEEIKKMHSAYESLSKDADNLVRALKSDTKTQGDWGEINLRRILDFTGLKEGVHYLVQPNYKNESGDNLRPDIVVNLPDSKQLIVDSKVSLTGYERYFNAVDDSEKDAGIKDHLKSIRKHIQELSEKKYEDLKDINTLDFVLMFIPVEAAYFVAVNNDTELYQYASGKKVLLVCPSTLLITMQLVGSLWRIDDQKRHVHEIAEQGALLYAKFVGFVNSMTDIKKHLDNSVKAYEKAHSQLAEGKGNLISQATKLVKLGVKTKTTAKLPDNLLLASEQSEFTDETEEIEGTILEDDNDEMQESKD
jgi:DNA recombination protein RmuC